MEDMEMLRSYLLSAETPSDFKATYVKALSSSGPIQANRANALKNYDKHDTQRKLNQVELAETRSLKILEDKLPCSFMIDGRKKAFIKYTKKLHQKDFEDIHDLYGFQIILNDKKIGNDSAACLCYDTSKWLIHDMQITYGYYVIKVIAKAGHPPDEIRNKIFIPSSRMDLGGHSPYIKDYIQYPKTNGYQALHIVLRTPDSLDIEVQIKTLTMYTWAEYGLANHEEVYKPEDEIDALIKMKGENFVEDLLYPVHIGTPLVREFQTEKFPEFANKTQNLL